MAKTNLEAQREFRQRRAETHKRLSDMWISHDANGAWDRLAKHHGLSRVACLEKLLIEADQKLSDGMDDDDFPRYIMG